MNGLFSCFDDTLLRRAALMEALCVLEGIDVGHIGCGMPCWVVAQ